MPRLFLSSLVPNEGMDDEWTLFLVSSSVSMHCRLEGSYLAYEATISSTPPNVDLRYKDSIYLGIVKEGNVSTFREVILGSEANSEATFYSSHSFVKEVLEKLEQKGILDTDTEDFRKALKWIKRNYASGS